MCFGLKYGVLTVMLIIACWSCGRVTSAKTGITEAVAGEPTERNSGINAQSIHAGTTYAEVAEHLQQLKTEIEKEKQISPFVFKAIYQPHLMLALNTTETISPQAKIDKVFLQRAIDYNALHYIQFSMENKEFKSELLRFALSSAEDYADRIDYFSFRCGKDALLIEDGKDTLRAVFANYERTFDASPKINIVFAFERKTQKPLSTIRFIFNDEVFSNGKLNFEFDYSHLAHLNAPELKKIVL